MNKTRKWISATLSLAILASISTLYAPTAEAGVRVIRRSSCPPPAYYGPSGHCPAPGYYEAPRHVHTYAYQEQRRFIGYDRCGYPVYQTYYIRVRTCGC